MVVTGASRGLGKELCLQFTRLGMKVATMARNEEALKALEEEITALGRSVMILPLNVTDFDALGDAFAVDNCFASKRWTRPAKWMELICDLGIHYIEASADNECDPIYTTEETMNDWLHEAEEYCKKLGVQIANFYSGHGTYTTLGLGHTIIE